MNREPINLAAERAKRHALADAPDPHLIASDRDGRPMFTWSQLVAV